MSKAREAAARELHRMMPGVFDSFERDQEMWTNIASGTIDAFLAALSETHVVVPRDLMLKIIDHADAGRDYWYSEYSTGDERQKELNAEWAKDVEEARAAIAATLKQDAGQ